MIVPALAVFSAEFPAKDDWTLNNSFYQTCNPRQSTLFSLLSPQNLPLPIASNWK
jgi:hypothetical protein